MAEGESTSLSSTQMRDLPRSPTVISPSSSRKDSLRSSNNTEKESAPSPPLTRLMKKRAASLDTDAANNPSIANLSLHSASLESPRTDSNNQVCLCQPDPKIPRPRNAFILYRQHYQGQVIAQNPGLANPEISKIIGAQWREQSIETKNEWKKLAEEEKHRHQRQYPDYRYQPRRPGKLNGPRPTASPDDPLRCPKCNGRYFSTSGTPLTPLPPTPSIGNYNDKVAQPFSRAMDREGRYTTDSPGPFQDFRTGPPYPQPHNRRPQLHIEETGSQWHDSDTEVVHSPRAKRQKPNDNPNANPYPTQSWPNGPQRISRVPMSAVAYEPARIPNQRVVAYHHHGNHGMMEPPPRSTPISGQFPPHTPSHVRPQNLDDLRLPPLQTKIPVPGSAQIQQHQFHAQQQLLRNSSLSNSQSVEAMVMTIPFLNKIRVLAKIAPPLAPPGPTSPTQEVRGPVVSVEGTNQKLVAEVGEYIEDCLKQKAECLVKIWTSDSHTLSRRSESTPTEISMSGTENSAPASAGITSNIQSRGPIIDYLEAIGTWHSKSAEIRNFISTRPAPTTPPKSPEGTPKSPAPTTAPRLPIALLPRGFSLSLSDRAAIHIPINDVYAPVDHWQWMATLWRGIIGVDLTVYVCSGAIGDEDGSRGVHPGMGGVEVRNDARAIVVYAPGGKLEDKWLRRVGFEVAEFVIGGGLKG